MKPSRNGEGFPGSVLLAGVGILLVIAGCATTSFTEENSVTFRPGMAMEAVQSHLGSPTYRHAEDEGFVWIYVEQDVGQLLIRSSREEANTVFVRDRLIRQIRDRSRPYRTGDHRLDLRFWFDSNRTVRQVRHSVFRHREIRSSFPSFPSP